MLMAAGGISETQQGVSAGAAGPGEAVSTSQSTSERAEKSSGPLIEFAASRLIGRDVIRGAEVS